MSEMLVVVLDCLCAKRVAYASLPRLSPTHEKVKGRRVPTILLSTMRLPIIEYLAIYATYSLTCTTCKPPEKYIAV